MDLWFTGLKLQIQLYLVNPKPLGGEKGLLERGRKKKSARDIEMQRNFSPELIQNI